MKTYLLKRSQTLPLTMEQAWDFFSSPRNLVKITPSYMNFEIIDISGSEKMYAGQIVRYKVSVLPFVRVSWVTEITHVKAPGYFVDEQRFGPYRWWHHQHSFRPVAGGVEVTDEVYYALPLGWLGRVAHTLFVQRQLNSIFDYRYRVLENLFKEEAIRKSA